MPLYQYKAKNKSGKVIEEVIQSENKAEAVSFLKADDLQILTIRNLQDKDIKIFSKGVSVSEKAAFCRFMSTMLRAGLPMPEALDIIRQETQNKKLREILFNTSFYIRKGQALSTIFARYKSEFDPVFLTMIKAGEESGSLEKTFEYLSKQLLASYELVQKVKASLMYPAVIVVAMLANAVIMVGFVLPKMSEVFLSLSVELPPVTKFVFVIGKSVGQNLALTMGVLFGLVVFVVILFLVRKTREMIFSVFVKFPVVKTVMNELDTARFARTLATLLKSGVPIIASLDVATDVIKQPALKKMAKEFSSGVSKGESLSEILTKGKSRFPVTMTQTIRAGEKTGSLEIVLDELATFYETEVDFALKRATSLIEPLLMLIVGLVVGAMVIIMITPIYSIVGGLGN